MSLGLRLFLAFAMTHMVFAIWPSIDLALSGLFYAPGRGFPLRNSVTLEWLRQLLWNLVLFAVLAAILATVAALHLAARARVRARVWAYVVACFVLGPGLLVDAALKRFWGRARPSEVIEFGGTRPFTPPFEMADNCARNCSFVSGEAAGLAMLALVTGILCWHLVPGPRRAGMVLGLAAMAASGGAMRIVTGRHFLSDVIFAGFLMVFVALGLYRLIRMDRALHSLTLPNLRHDAGAIRADLRAVLARLQAGG